MKTKTNAELSGFVGSALRHAIHQGENFMLGYVRGQRKAMRREKTLSITAYVRGWNLAGRFLK